MPTHVITWFNGSSPVAVESERLASLVAAGPGDVTILHWSAARLPEEIVDAYQGSTVRARPVELRSVLDLDGILTATERAAVAGRDPAYGLGSGMATDAMMRILSQSVRPGIFIDSLGEIMPTEPSLDGIAGLVRSRTLPRTYAVEEESVVYDGMVYGCERMQEVMRIVSKAAAVDYPVLIQGESGTGKELLARRLHDESARAQSTMVTLNCGAIPAGLAESELFGYEKGAFTGADKAVAGHVEHADRSTLFLDEVGELPLDLQVRLLRVLEEGEVLRVGSRTPKKVDVRIVAATNRNLAREVEAGHFREDLFHRLSVIVVNAPPLRERRGDLPLLVERFVAEINTDIAARTPGYRKKTLSPEGMGFLAQLSWPGNVRELRNTLLRALLLSDSDHIGEKEIREVLLEECAISPDLMKGELIPGFSLDDALTQVAIHYIEKALIATDGRKAQAADILGLSSRQRLNYLIDKYGLSA